MAYKEPKFDSKSSKAFLASINSGMTAKPKKTTAKSKTTKKK